MEDLIKKINLIYRPCTDMVKTDAKDIEQEKLDNEYNLALTDVLKLLKQESDCEHDWYRIPNYDGRKETFDLCKKCKAWRKL